MSTFEELAYMSKKKEVNKWETSKYLEKGRAQNIL